MCTGSTVADWFEIFETLRKVLLVGIPAVFADRGGNTQLIWGLMVCFITFGMYMMYQPFIRDSDDTLQQFAQGQIFLSLVASIGLRMKDPDPTLGNLVRRRGSNASLVAAAHARDRLVDALGTVGC